MENLLDFLTRHGIKVQKVNGPHDEHPGAVLLYDPEDITKPHEETMPEHTDVSDTPTPPTMPDPAFVPVPVATDEPDKAVQIPKQDVEAAADSVLYGGTQPDIVSQLIAQAHRHDDKG